MDYKKLIISIIIPFLASIIGASTNAGSDWYQNLIKPSFNPPSWIFGPVWTILYLTIGISLYWIWTNKKTIKRTYYAFATQMSLNAIWSILFFGIQKPLWAFIEIILLWAAIIWTIIEFYKTDKKAGYILIPYLLWVSFASILNFAIYYLN